MYFADFQDLLRRNQATNAQITFYRDPKINPNNIAIFDRKLVRRNPEFLEKTGWDEEDHWRDSHICELAFFNGEIPLEGYTPKTEDGKLVGKLYRGALSAISILVDRGCLRRTDELRELFSQYGRRLS